MPTYRFPVHTERIEENGPGFAEPLLQLGEPRRRQRTEFLVAREEEVMTKTLDEIEVEFQRLSVLGDDGRVGK
jgi:hypothetical protein